MRLGERYVLRPARPEDGRTILPALRKVDRTEWHASILGGAEGNLEDSIKSSAECWAVAETSGLLLPHIIFGVTPCPMPHEPPYTWMLGTDHGQRECAWMWQLCREWSEDFFRRWPNTQCFSDARNTAHHQWLEWLGYTLAGTVPWGPYGMPFRHYIKEG